MKTVPVVALRRNLTQTLSEVEQGESCIVTRHNRDIARLVPPAPAATVTPMRFRVLLLATTLAEDWAVELDELAAGFGGTDPWVRTARSRSEGPSRPESSSHLAR